MISPLRPESLAVRTENGPDASVAGSLVFVFVTQKRRSRSIRTNERGVGLISVMVSIVILLAALSMITSTFMGASRLTHRAASFTSTSNFAEGIMEEVTSRPFDKIVSMKVISGLPKLPGAECDLSVQNAGDGVKAITVTCSWLEGQQRRKTAFSTLIAKGYRR